MSINIRLKDELIKEWVNLISRDDLKIFLKKWGYKIEEEHLTKFEMFKKAIGNKLTNEQFQKFWLLKEKSGFKNRNWALYRFDSKKMEDIEDLNQLKKSITNEMDKIINSKLEYAIYIEKFEDLGTYIIFDFKGSPRIIEDFGFKFKLFHNIQRIRCLVGIDNFIQISGFSKGKIDQCLRVIEAVFKIKTQSVPIYSYAVRDFIQQMKPIQKLVVVCPREMGGFSGVERITVEGPNVVDGMEDLRSRQEILFNFEGLSKLGAWTVVKSKNAKIDVHGKIRLGDKDTKGKVLYFLRE
ncbi:MAG: hypothetical protein ACTSRG_10225 [Candidatus Helarchaeota archaeon]